MNLTQNTILRSRYSIEKSLGKGGFGQVYKAKDLQFQNRAVAIKQRIPQNPADKREEELFLRESQFLVKLKHPGIPEIYDFFIDTGFQFIVMQFIEGNSLENILKDRGLVFSEQEILPLMTQLAQILEYLQSRPVPLIHRDIKPDNLIIDKNKKLFLVDFGISRLYVQGKLRDTIRIGTIGYMAPEHFAAKSLPQSDIFSFGATFHHLLSGIDPKEKDQSKMFIFEPLRKINNSISPGMESLIKNCLQEIPENRIKSPSKILEFIQNIVVNQKEALTSYPKTDDPSFWLHRGKFFMEQNDFKQALECFVMSRKLGINNQDIVVYIARCHRKMGNKHKARQILDHLLINSYPREDTLVELVLTIDNPDEKTKILEKYISDNPLWNKVKVHLINSLINSKKYIQAQSFIDEILKKDPENIKVIAQKTAILSAQGKLEEIEKYLSGLSPGLLEHPDILYKRGLVRELQGQDGEAFTYYKKAIEKSEHSENPELMLKMAGLLWKKSSFYEAKELYIKVINRDKNNFRLKKELGCNLCREGFYEEAIFYLKEAVYHLPDDPEILKNIGLALGERKNYQEALGYLVKYSKLSPGDLKILKVIGRFYALSDNFYEAKLCLQKYTSAFPKDVNGHKLLKQVMSKVIK